MQMNPGIILAGEPVNALASYMSGQGAAQQRGEWDRQNALAQLYKTQGAGLISGDQTALNALAGLDPQTAMQMQTQQQSLAMDRERLQMARTAAAREAEAWAMDKDAATVAAERERLATGLKGASYFFAQGDQAGYEAFLKQQGVDPAQFPFEQFPAYAAGAEGVLEALTGFTPKAVDPMDALKLEEQRLKVEAMKNPPPEGPLTTEAKLKADLDAGRIDRATYEAALARMAPKGTSLTFDPTTGAMTFNDGPGVAGGVGGPTVGQVYNPNEVSAVIDLIDQITADPNLPGVVGGRAMLLGGGNMPDEMNLAQRLGYGQGGLSVIEKIGQLQSNTWFSARAMLKGGGPITDYESRKAEAAVSRLARPKSEEDFRAALQELRDAIVEGQAKLAAAAAGGQATAPPSQGLQPGAVEDGYRFKGGDPSNPDNWEPAQ